MRQAVDDLKAGPWRTEQDEHRGYPISPHPNRAKSMNKALIWLSMFYCSGALAMNMGRIVDGEVLSFDKNIILVSTDQYQLIEVPRARYDNLGGAELKLGVRVHFLLPDAEYDKLSRFDISPFSKPDRWFITGYVVSFDDKLTVIQTRNQRVQIPRVLYPFPAGTLEKIIVPIDNATYATLVRGHKEPFDLTFLGSSWKRVGKSWSFFAQI
jgi:RNase P/RNase MRP subunit p29